MSNIIKRRNSLIALLAFGVSLTPVPAAAHPHVYVTVETTVLYDKGTITGLRQRWLFDEFYSSMAIEGLDANNDGVFDRKELAELAKVNVDGLAQMDYFSFAKLGSQKLAFDAPTDYWLEHAAITAPPGPARAMTSVDGAPPAVAPEPEAAGFWSKLVKGMTSSDAPAADAPVKVLALEFTLPLKQPVLAEAEGFEYSIYDPGFWIWFDLTGPKAAVMAAGSPPACKIAVGMPQKDAAELQKLGESFFNQMGGSQPGPTTAKSVSVVCPKL